MGNDNGVVRSFALPIADEELVFIPTLKALFALILRRPVHVQLPRTKARATRLCPPIFLLAPLLPSSTAINRARPKVPSQQLAPLTNQFRHKANGLPFDRGRCDISQATTRLCRGYIIFYLMYDHRSVAVYWPQPQLLVVYKPRPTGA